MDDVFISYKREERDIAQQLAGVLLSRGWSVWWDVKLQAGEHFDDKIEEAIRNVKCVIVLWSKRAVTSRYIKDEATFALKLKKLLPVKLDALNEVDLPMKFQGLHTISLRGWRGSITSIAFQELENSIEAKVGRQTTGGKTVDPTMARLTVDAKLLLKKMLMQTDLATPSAAELGVNPRSLLNLHQNLKSWAASRHYMPAPTRVRAKTGSLLSTWGCISRDELYDFAHFLEQPFTPRSSVYSISGGTQRTLDFTHEVLTGLESKAAHAVNCIPEILKAQAGLRTSRDLPMCFFAPNATP